MTDGPAETDLSDEQARQVAAVLDVCLERGFDEIEGVEREVLEAAHEVLERR